MYNNGQNIKDAQQRTISLSLLLKALYVKAFKDRSEETKNLMAMLESSLWDIDDISAKADYNASHLQSDVISKEDEDILKQILTHEYKLENNNIETKIKKVTSNYEKNYLFFLLKSDEFAKENPTKGEKFCEGYDENSRLENALRIFTTLNNRAIALSDSDIFKSIIFKSKKTLEGRKEFANKKNLKIKKILYLEIICMLLVLDIKTSEIGLRVFFHQRV